MIDIEALTAAVKPDLRTDEGFRGKPYNDTKGALTIGYGRNLDANGITRIEAEYLFSNDIAAAIADCARSFPWFGILDLVRQGVVVNLRFNLGLAGLLGFHAMLRACNAGDWIRAAEELLDSQAARDLPTRYERLALRLRSGRQETTVK